MRDRECVSCKKDRQTEREERERESPKNRQLKMENSNQVKTGLSSPPTSTMPISDIIVNNYIENNMGESNLLFDNVDQVSQDERNPLGNGLALSETMFPAVKALSSEMTGIIGNIAQKFNGGKVLCDKVIVSGLPEDWTNLDIMTLLKLSLTDLSYSGNIDYSPLEGESGVSKAHVHGHLFSVQLHLEMSFSSLRFAQVNCVYGGSLVKGPQAPSSLYLTFLEVGENFPTGRQMGFARGVGNDVNEREMRHVIIKEALFETGIGFTVVLVGLHVARRAIDGEGTNKWFTEPVFMVCLSLDKDAKKARAVFASRISENGDGFGLLKARGAVFDVHSTVSGLVSRKFLTVDCCEQAAGFVCATACGGGISISEAITNLLLKEGNSGMVPQTAFFNAVNACLLVGLLDRHGKAGGATQQTGLITYLRGINESISMLTSATPDLSWMEPEGQGWSRVNKKRSPQVLRSSSPSAVIPSSAHVPKDSSPNSSSRGPVNSKRVRGSSPGQGITTPTPMITRSRSPDVSPQVQRDIISESLGICLPDASGRIVGSVSAAPTYRGSGLVVPRDIKSYRTALSMLESSVQAEASLPMALPLSSTPAPTNRDCIKAVNHHATNSQERNNKLNARTDVLEARTRAEFGAMAARMSKLERENSSLQAQIRNLNVEVRALKSPPVPSALVLTKTVSAPSVNPTYASSPVAVGWNSDQLSALFVGECGGVRVSMRVASVEQLLQYIEYVRGASPGNIFQRCLSETCPLTFGVGMSANPHSGAWSSHTLGEGACLLEAIREAFLLAKNQYFQSSASLAQRKVDLKLSMAGGLSCVRKNLKSVNPPYSTRDLSLAHRYLDELEAWFVNKDAMVGSESTWPEFGLIRAMYPKAIVSQWLVEEGKNAELVESTVMSIPHDGFSLEELRSVFVSNSHIATTTTSRHHFSYPVDPATWNSASSAVDIILKKLLSLKSDNLYRSLHDISRISSKCTTGRPPYYASPDELTSDGLSFSSSSNTPASPATETVPLASNGNRRSSPKLKN